MLPTRPTHRRTPVVSLIRNPFTRQSSHMRRNSLNNKWISIPSITFSPLSVPFASPVSTHPSPAHPIEIRTPATNDSHKASVVPDSEDNESAIASSGFLSPFGFDFNTPSNPISNRTDTYIRVPQQEMIKPKPRPRVQFAGLVSQTHTSPVSPEGEWKPNRRDSPVSGVDLGWEHIQTGQNKAEQKQNGLGIALLSDIGDTHAPARTVRPRLPPRPVRSQPQPLSKPQPNLFPSRNGKARYPPPHGAKTSQVLEAPPAVVHRYKNGRGKDGLSHFLDRTREIYHAGPKGEGQKVWSGIKRLREERKEKKQANRQLESFSNTRFEEARKSEIVKQPPSLPCLAHRSVSMAQGKTLPETQTRSQYLKDKPYPRLPSESSRLYPVSPITERGSAGAVRAAHVMHQGKWNGKGCEPIRQSEATINSSVRSIDLPLKASDSVQYDATHVELDIVAPRPSSFNLQPAPRSRKGSSNGSTSSRETSPIPPKVPEKEAHPVPRKNDAHDVSQSKSGSAQVLAVRYANLLDVQKQRPNFDRDADRNQTGKCIAAGSCLPKEKEHKVDWLHKMGHLKVPDFPHDWVHTDRDLTRRKEKLKAKIGQPHPLTGLTGETVNVAEESGGVGGPAAARWMPPVHRGQTDPIETSKKGKEKQKEAPPRPEPPTEAQKPSKLWMKKWAQSPSELMEDKNRLFQAHARSKSRPRVSDGSLGSFACQGVDHADFYNPPSPAQTKRPGRESSREKWPLPRDAYAEHDNAGLAPAYADPDLLPLPLFRMRGIANNNDGEDEERGRSQIRNTKFYQPYGDILEQYGGKHYDEHNRF